MTERTDRPAHVRRVPQEPVALLLSGLLGAPVDDAALTAAFASEAAAAPPSNANK